MATSKPATGVRYVNANSVGIPNADASYLEINTAAGELNLYDDNAKVWTAYAISALGDSAGIIQFKSNDYTLLVSDQGVIVDASALAREITLPAANAAGTADRTYFIKNQLDDSFNVTVTPDGADTIENLSNATLLSTNSITITSDGVSNWLII